MKNNVTRTYGSDVKRSGIAGRLTRGLMAIAIAVTALAGTAGAANPNSSTTNSFTVTPTSVNSTAEFSINVTTTAKNGPPNSIPAGTEVIVTFDDGIVVPASISSSAVTADGTNPSGSVTVTGQVVSFGLPFSIPGSGATKTYNIIFSESAGIRNPSTASTAYDVTVTVGGVGEGNPTYTTSTADSEVSEASVTPSPSVESEAATYTIGFNVGASGYLTANVSTITITFPSGTTIADGNVSGVTVNGTSANASASSRVVTITTPVTIDNNGSVTVFFGEGASIDNPTAGSYSTLSVYTSVETTPINAASYTISSANALSVTAVNVTPNTANRTAAYELAFRVGSGGALSAGTGTIIITFPENTYVPSSIATSAITVSSNSFSDDAHAVSVSGQAVTITTPVSVANSGDVEVTISTGAGIKNPSNPGNYQINLDTSEDDDVDSNPYTIAASSSTVSTASVELSSYTPDAEDVDYTLTFNTGTYGRLYPGSSKIIVTFPTGTIVDESTPSTVTVNETSAGTVAKDADTRTVTITVPGSIEIDDTDEVVVVISDGIDNPGDGTYTIQIATTPEPTKVASASYTITTTTPVTITNVALNTTNAVNSATEYAITFSGAIGLNTQRRNDYIAVEFPVGTILPSGDITDQVTVSGATKASATSNPDTRRVYIYAGGSPNSFEVPTGVTFAVGAGIQNPSVPSTSVYKLKVWTSQNQAVATSAAYTITAKTTTSVTGVGGTASPNVVDTYDGGDGDGSAFSVLFTTSGTGRLQGGTAAGSSYITVDFDGGIYVPPSITASNVQVAGTTASAVEVVTPGDGGKVIVAVPSGVTVANSEETNVYFNADAGLATTNVTAGDYTVTVWTTADSAAAGESGSYTLTATQNLTVTQASVSPTTINASAAYTIKFTLGSSGALSEGDDIILTFPDNTFIPASIPKTDILVNTVALAVAPTTNPTNRTITLDTPEGGLGSLANVTVQISSAAGVLNPTAIGSYVVNVKTVAETNGGNGFDSPAYTTTSASSTVSAASVTVNPAQTSQLAAYSITFSTGANGRLIPGTSTITITFPSGTTLGTAVAGTPGYTSVNGTPATTVTTPTATSVRITVPSGVSIGNSASVTVAFQNQTNMITNPTTAGSRTVSVATSVEPSAVSSNAYSIAAIATEITVGTVLVSPATTRRPAAYTIPITPTTTTGTIGAGGTITIEFPSITVVPNGTITASEVTVGGTAASAVSGNSSTHRITITVAAEVTGGSASNVVISVDAGIVNPNTPGDYTLSAWTSVEPTPVTSAAYTLADQESSVSDVSVVADPLDTDAPVQWTWTFTTSQYGSLVANSDTIGLIYPTAVGLPASISASKVTVQGVAASAVTFSVRDIDIEGTPTEFDVVSILVPTNIAGSTEVIVVVALSADIVSPATMDKYDYYIYTSADRIEVMKDYSLPVELTSFTGAYQAGAVMLQWRTESEVENLGFHVWRAESEDGPYVQVTTSLIPGLGNSAFGGDYEWSDESLVPGIQYFYKLQDISWTGLTEMHGPVAVATGSYDLSLLQNSPNPFNPVTTIQFSLPERGAVNLVIYSATGQVVRTLIAEEREIGIHRAVWNGTDNSGREVGSGMYIYRLGTPAGTLTKRMLLVR